MKILNSLLMFFERFIQLRAIHPVSKVGRTAFIGGMIGGTTIYFSTSIEGVPLELGYSTGSGAALGFVIAGLGFLLMVVGAFMTVASHRAKIVYLQGLPFSPPTLADKVIGKPYSLHHPQRVILEVDSTNAENMLRSINSECRVLLRQVGNDSRHEKVFFAGLARVPCLFVIGSFFRTCGIDVEPIERFRSPDRWARLKFLENVDRPDVKFSGDLDGLISEDKEVGISISITSEVLVDELPDYIRNHTASFNLRPDVKSEAFTVLSHVNDFSAEFKGILNKASKKADVIHLFICAQSSLVFELGRKYQEGMHSALVIHNYDPSIKGYPWAFQIVNGEVSLYQR